VALNGSTARRPQRNTQALNIPRYRLHPANWRIIFRFEGTDAFDVELIDYH
jgi:hypothetical protein